jgi:hypothetical protein
VTARRHARLAVLVALGAMLAAGPTPALAARTERCVTAPAMPGGSPARAMTEPIERQEAGARALREQARRLAGGPARCRAGASRGAIVPGDLRRAGMCAVIAHVSRSGGRAFKPGTAGKGKER